MNVHFSLPNSPICKPPGSPCKSTGPLRNDVNDFSIDTVPHEILLHILGFIDTKELAAICCLNRQFCRLMADATLWDNVVKKALGFSPTLHKPEHISGLRFYRLMTSCRYTRPASSQFIEAHTDAVTSIQSINSDLIATGSKDTLIKIWESQTFKNKQTLQGHRQEVRSLVACFKGEMILSGSADKNIVQWQKGPTGQWVMHKILYGHEDEILHLDALNSCEFLSIGYNTFRSWNLRTGHNALLLKDTDFLQNPVLAEDSVIACHEMSQILNINVQWKRSREGELTPQLRCQYASATDVVTCIKPCGQTLFIGGSDGSLSALNIETGTHLRSFSGHTSKITCLQTLGELLFSGSSDKTIRIWDIPSGCPLATLVGHNEEITELYIHPNYIISGTIKGVIGVWQFTPKKVEAC